MSLIYRSSPPGRNRESTRQSAILKEPRLSRIPTGAIVVSPRECICRRSLRLHPNSPRALHDTWMALYPQGFRASAVFLKDSQKMLLRTCIFIRDIGLNSVEIAKAKRISDLLTISYTE